MERAILVSVHAKDADRTAMLESLEELQGLVEATGSVVVGQLTQAREIPATGLGRGALEQLKSQLSAEDATLVVFDQELSPSQLTVIQRVLGDRVGVLDRTHIILDIFSRRASSREGRLQVELAQYRYLEPRLRGMRAHSRLGGGVGTRGPGETFLEMDRRRVRNRIHELEGLLEQVDRERQHRRQRRRQTELPLIALVGYTNVGKSTLFSRLTKRPQIAQDALFVTLDATIRRIVVPGFGPALVSDTVGFIDRLPHHLIAAFRSTLDEVRHADVLIQVMNAEGTPVGRHRVAANQEAQVIEETLGHLGVECTPRILVYNRWDRVPVGASLPGDGIALSALTGAGIDALLTALRHELAQQHQEYRIRVPWSNREAWVRIYRDFVIVDRQDGDESAELVLRGPIAAFAALSNVAEHEILRCQKT